MRLLSYRACFTSPTLNPVSCPLWREHKMLHVKPRTGRTAPWQHRPNSSAHKRGLEGREKAERGRLHGVSRGKLSIYSKTRWLSLSRASKRHAGASRWLNKWLQAQTGNSISESFRCTWEKVANKIGWPAPFSWRNTKNIYLSQRARKKWSWPVARFS